MPETLYGTNEAAAYLIEKSGGTITKRTVHWYIRDQRGREKAAREGVLQGQLIGKSLVFTQEQLDHFLERYPQISKRGPKTAESSE